MILFALRVAKRKKQCISLAFCDIAKAYDTVCRKLLYIRRATNCEFTIMNLTRGMVDRSLVARCLWEACAIPSILYCLEAMVFTRKTLAELEQIQGMVGMLFSRSLQPLQTFWFGVMLA